MKKRIEETVMVERDFCNICEKEITHRGSGSQESLALYHKRIAVVRNLGKTRDFDAHQGCINKIIREAFSDFL